MQAPVWQSQTRLGHVFHWGAPRDDRGERDQSLGLRVPEPEPRRAQAGAERQARSPLQARVRVEALAQR